MKLLIVICLVVAVLIAGATAGWIVSRLVNRHKEGRKLFDFKNEKDWSDAILFLVTVCGLLIAIFHVTYLW